MALLDIPKNQRHYYILSIVLILFIVFPVNIPHEIASLIDTVIGKAIIVIVVLNLFLAHPVVGSIAVVAAYELVKRSSGAGSGSKTAMSKFIPSEKKRASNLNVYNQFPLTVEEIVIKSKIPYSFNLTTPGDKPSYRPIQDDTHEATIVS